MGGSRPVTAAADERARYRLPDSVRRSEFVGAGGVRLVSYDLGPVDAPVLAMVLPIGLVVEIVAPLAAALGERYRFLTWEARLSPGADGVTGSTECGVDAHVEDLLRLLDGYGVERALALFSWCNSTQIALRFAYAHRERIGALVLVSPYLKGVAEEPSRRVNFMRVFQSVVRQPRTADVIVRSRNPALVHPDALKAEYMTESVEVARFLARAYTSPEMLRRYAFVMNALDRAERIPLSQQVEVPTLVLTGLRDEVATPAIAKAIVDSQQGARMLSVPSGDHYLPCEPGGILPGLFEFLRECERPADGAPRPLST